MGIGKFCRRKRLPKRKRVVILSKNSQFEECSMVPLHLNGLLAGISDFGEDIVSEAGSALGGISSHDTDSDYNTEPSIISGISSSFNRKGL